MSLAISAVVLEHRSSAQGQMAVTYGGRGVQTLTYGADTLEDLGKYPSDAFHIWHMKMSDLNGNARSSRDYDWGENARSRTWNQQTKTWTYAFSWGSIAVAFQSSGNTLQIAVTETNNANSGVVLQGAQIFPLGLHFPRLPKNFGDPSYPQLAYNTTAPSATVADYGSGEVIAAFSDASAPLYSGFLPIGDGSIGYTPIISSTSPDGLATFQPHNDRPVLPGQTDSFVVTLRFATSGTNVATVASDVFSSWAKTWPAELNWKDRRPIGTVFLASSPSGDVHQPGGFRNNPRRYFNDGNANDFDVTTAAGLKAFQVRVLQQAQANADNAKRLGAQGVITWDIEGEQYPQDTSYVCEPDQIAQVAPEMESIISDPASPYQGSRLDDAYFKIMTGAGLRVGVCIRPQHFSMNADGTAQQTYLPVDSVATEMLRKMKFAHDRWGATLFYVDSSVESNGAVLSADIFRALAKALPDSLIMPEESTYKHYAYTAPFQTFLFHGDLGTNDNVYAAYPRAFSVNLINDVSPASLAAGTAALTASVVKGDVLMAHAGYWQANNDAVVSIYKAALASTTPAPPVSNPDPVLPLPVIASPLAGATVSGKIVVTGQIQSTLNPAALYLMVDGLRMAQGRVSGSSTLFDLDTTTLPNGEHTLQLGVAIDQNKTLLSLTVKVFITNTAIVAPVPPPPVALSYPILLTYPASGQTVSGTVIATGVIPQTLDSAGSYLMVDGNQVGSQRTGSAPYRYGLDTTLLTEGLHVLQLWAHDIGNNVLLSNQVKVYVSR